MSARVIRPTRKETSKNKLLKTTLAAAADGVTGTASTAPTAPPAPPASTILGFPQEKVWMVGGIAVTMVVVAAIIVMMLKKKKAKEAEAKQE